MKPMFIFLLVLTAVLAATANAGPVLDINGKLISGGSYYVLSAIAGHAGGGLSFVPDADFECPLYIGQEASEVNKGIPVIFSNWTPKVDYVPESANLHIKMDVAATTCDESTYWWVVSSFFKFYIRAGPKPEDSIDSIQTFFQIKKNEEYHYNVYNIEFCTDSDGCVGVGISLDENGDRRLTLESGAMPFPVVFMKANETENSSKII